MGMLETNAGKLKRRTQSIRRTTAKSVVDLLQQHTDKGYTIRRAGFVVGSQIDPDSILSGWTGASTNVVVRINDGGGAANDKLQVWNASNGSQLPLGQVDLGRKDYVGGNRTFGASGTASAMVQGGATITITLGTASGAGTTAGGNGTMSWTPSNSAYDRARNACSTAVATESGGADPEF